MPATLVECANPAGTHRMVVHVWGDPGGDPDSSHTVVCVHGLTRNGRDFDFLAQALAPRARVLSVDVVGRGESDWLPPEAEYGYPQYFADMRAMFEQLNLSGVDWVGTSMGGIIGMSLAAQQDGAIGRLVLNDIGPFIPKAGLARIGDYVGKDPRFADLAEARTYFAEVHAGFGPLDEVHIDHMVRHGVGPDSSGAGYRLRYDPRIGRPFQEDVLEDIDLWEVWDAVVCPTLVLRGERSELLLAETAREMERRGPCADVRSISDCAHAPSLMQPEQIAVVTEWLLGGEAA
jgi:pimeloyl-ACP methyl ester carboxylesterase